MYHRRLSAHEIISHEPARQISSLSHEIKRQIGLIVSRKGEVVYVIVGDRRHIWIPDLSKYRLGTSRLKGLRCIHTHLDGEPLSEEDLADLVLLALDLMVCVEVRNGGHPGKISYAHIMPGNASQGNGWDIRQVPDVGQLDVDFEEMIRSLEAELARSRDSRRLAKKDRALLVGVTTGSARREAESLDELQDLAVSNEVVVLERVIQQVKRTDPRFLMGKGKLSELVLMCLQTGADLLIFNNELSPAQVKNLNDFTELKIIDRSQLILDIFARRAVSREGKIQVELAQLQYLLPRLATKNTAMSRLTGGIGGRGPGETKLEINRRRVRERIAKLNRELQQVKRQRAERRRLRSQRRLPVISIVGYTNAGKSTLLNALTDSRVDVKNRLFETLDPSSRRLRFPREREAVITDTVGFIRDLPKSLMEAFAATLEELDDADLLLHVVDATSPRLEEQVRTVERILANLELADIPTLLVLNKTDLLDPAHAEQLARGMEGISISAIQPPTLLELTRRIAERIWPAGSEADPSLSNLSAGA